MRYFFAGGRGRRPLVKVEAYWSLEVMSLCWISVMVLEKSVILGGIGIRARVMGFVGLSAWDGWVGEVGASSICICFF